MVTRHPTYISKAHFVFLKKRMGGELWLESNAEVWGGARLVKTG